MIENKRYDELFTRVKCLSMVYNKRTNWLRIYKGLLTNHLHGKAMVARSGLFLGNFHEIIGKFLNYFPFLENFLIISQLFLYNSGGSRGGSKDSMEPNFGFSCNRKFIARSLKLTARFCRFWKPIKILRIMFTQLSKLTYAELLPMLHLCTVSKCKELRMVCVN